VSDRDKRASLGCYFDRHHAAARRLQAAKAAVDGPGAAAGAILERAAA
jgi:hypothetical protein